MANMARLYLEQGFYRKADEMLSQAREEKVYHENVDFYSNQLKGILEKETNEEQAIPTKVRDYREFVFDFARAVSMVAEEYNELEGVWITDTEEFKEFRLTRISLNRLKGEHEMERETSPSVNLLAAPPAITASFLRQRIAFEGTLIKAGIVFSVQINRGGILTTSTVTGLAIVASNDKIRFMAEKEGEFKFFMAKKKKSG